MIRFVESAELLLHIIVGEIVEFIMMSDSMVELLTEDESTFNNELGDVFIVGIDCEFNMTSAESGDGFVGLVDKQLDVIV